jgi:hypothetical protein
MSGSHGELFGEIGKLVLAANSGEAIDLDAKSEELAQRYNQLGVSEAVIASAIARSIGAIGFSIARVSLGEVGGNNSIPAANDDTRSGDGQNGHDHNGSNGAESSDLPALPKSVFPSGVRLAVLS